LFVATHRVHLVDLPGFGDAPAPPADWDTVKYADLLEHWLRDRVRGSVVIVGHSFGGRVAVRLAARQLPQITGVVLMGVPGLPASRFSKRALRQRSIRSLRELLRLLRSFTGPAPLDWHTHTFGSVDYLAAGDLRSLLVRTVNEDLTESARAVRCPTLLLWGSEDVDAPLWLAYRYQSLMTGHATLEVLPHKDHHLYTGTGAHLCAFKIRSWLPAHADI
jgi:pimeloyl-ACP methyl ester carboxylesterase